MLEDFQVNNSFKKKKIQNLVVLIQNQISFVK